MAVKAEIMAAMCKGIHLQYLLVFLASMILTACSNGEDGKVVLETKEDAPVAQGLKIFVSQAMHDGNFLNSDHPTLNLPEMDGLSAIDKADALCNSDLNKPAGESQYKALLVDGIDRDAVSLTDWVLQPNTTYYLPYQEQIVDEDDLDNDGDSKENIYVDVEIGTTNAAGIFPFQASELSQSFAEKQPMPKEDLMLINFVYTGVSDTSNFSTDGVHNCENWTSDRLGSYTYSGAVFSASEHAIKSDITYSCNFHASLYCVEQ